MSPTTRSFSTSNIWGLFKIFSKTTRVTVLGGQFYSIWKVEIHTESMDSHLFFCCNASNRNVGVGSFDRRITNQAEIFRAQERDKFTRKP